MTINIEQFFNFRHWFIPGYEVDQIENILVPEEFSVEGPQLLFMHRDMFDVPISGFEPIDWMKWTGNILPMKEKERNSVLNLGIFVKVEARHQIKNKESLHPSAFLRYIPHLPSASMPLSEYIKETLRDDNLWKKYRNAITIKEDDN